MKLINVRLDARDARKADALRKQGVEISSVVREAIRAEYERRRKRRRDDRSAAEIMAEIYAKHPDPADLPPRDYDVHDAKQARAAIIANLKKGAQVILLDTGPLVALTDPRDALHDRALADLDRIKRGETFYTCLPALSEACFHLPGETQRQRLRLWFSELSISPFDTPDEESLWDAVFQWMAKFAEHSPDLADAWLAVLCGADRRLKVWTYDSQFTTIWRRADGTPIPLAVAD